MLVSSTPTGRTPAAVAPASSPDSKRLPASAPAERLPVGAAHHHEAFEVGELAVEGAQQAAAHAAEELLVDARPAADELAADDLAEPFDQFRLGLAFAFRVLARAEAGVVGPGGLARDAGEVERLAHRHDRRERPAALRDRVAHEPVDLVGGRPRNTSPTLRPLSSPCTASG